MNKRNALILVATAIVLGVTVFREMPLVYSVPIAFLIGWVISDVFPVFDR